MSMPTDQFALELCLLKWSRTPLALSTLMLPPLCLLVLSSMQKMYHLQTKRHIYPVSFIKYFWSSCWNSIFKRFNRRYHSQHNNWYPSVLARNRFLRESIRTSPAKRVYCREFWWDGSLACGSERCSIPCVIKMMNQRCSTYVMLGGTGRCFDNKLVNGQISILVFAKVASEASRTHLI